MSTVTAPTWTDDEIDDHVMGSGVESFPWYAEEIGEEVLGVCHYGDYVTAFGEWGTTPTSVRFSRDKFRRAAQTIVDGKVEIAADIRQSIIDNDLDAGAVDCIIQVATLGEVQYG